MRKEVGWKWFDRLPFKLFTLKFSNKSVQSSSCERPKTAQRIMFLLFANNNCYPTTLQCRRNIKKIRETYKPRGEFKHRQWFFADTPNIAWIVSIIWKDLLWRADLYRLLKYRGWCTIPMFQLSLWCEKCDAARHNSVFGNQLLF